MKVKINNIGKVSDAAIEIDGIAVIAGDNGTGKSTIGRSLYSIYSSLLDSDKEIERMRFSSIRDKLLLARRLASRELFDDERREINVPELAETIAKLKLDEGRIRDLLSKSFGAHLSDAVESSLVGGMTGLAHDITEIASISDDEAFLLISSSQIGVEFNKQVSSTYNELPGSIELSIKDKFCRLDIVSNRVVKASDHPVLASQIYYIDDSHFVDSLNEERLLIRPYGRRSHRANLERALRRAASATSSLSIDNIIREKQLSSIIDMVNSAFPGSFARSADEHSFVYIEKGGKEGIKPSNLSDGMKAFAQIKLLLESGLLLGNGAIILDEPENHLHPEWQLIFAEIIVLMQKNLGIHVLISTHSPYFVRAIEVYSARHEIADKCTYYHAKCRPDGQSSFFDVTCDTEMIYESLARPFQLLETLRWESI